MKVFVIAAMGAVALAGCAPFEHGHYSNDVSFLNSNGDPRGTPLVYQDGPVQNAQFAPTSFPAAPSFAQNAFGAGGFPIAQGQQVAQFSQPVSYPTPVQSFNVAQAPIRVAPAPIQRASVVVPTVSQPISYTPAVQQTYVPPVQTTLAPVVQNIAPVVHRVAPPVRHTIVRQVVAQAPAPQPVRQLLTRASYVEPTKPSSTVVATSFGGHQVDADGYAICNVQLPNHAGIQTPKYKRNFQPASHVQRSQPQPMLRF